MRKHLFLLFIALLSLNANIYANNSINAPIVHQTSIIGGGIIGSLEAYYAFKDAQNLQEKVCITVYEKDQAFTSTNETSTNTSFNIVPSLTIDEILSVVPRGSELVDKLAIHFSQPGGIRVDDVKGANDTNAAIDFKEAVTIYGSDINHDDRTLALLTLGKKSHGAIRRC